MAQDHPVAVVTGAGSGIGRALAVAMLERGFNVVLAGRHEDSLRQSLDSVDGRTSPSALLVTADVRHPEDVDQLFSRTKGHFGRIDLLVNNAGVFGPSLPVDQVDFTDWMHVIDTNVTGMFLCAQAAFRMMKEQDPQGGRIINNGSLSAHVPRPHAIAYTTSKHAVTGLTKALALEGRSVDISCAQIDVGNAATEMTGHFSGAGTLQPDGTLAPEPTIAVRHVVDAVLYMASLPLDVSVPSLTVMAAGMPYVGRG